MKKKKGYGRSYGYEEQEFNLSERINSHGRGIECLWKEDVKEFIRRLKEEINLPNLELQRAVTQYMEYVLEQIDKLAGEKLI